MLINTPVGAEDDVDERAVRWVCQGTRMRLSDRDATEAIFRLKAAGVGVDGIAMRLYRTRRQIETLVRVEHRRRAQQRQAAA